LILPLGCKKVPVDRPFDASGVKVLVLNEGNFLWNNASFDLYNPKTGQLKENVYKLANGKAMGDVLQSAAIINGNLWLVLNNSGKILVLDTQNFKEKFSIAGLRSPRYLYESAGKVWISDLYAGMLTVVDANSGKLLKKVQTGIWSEQFLNDGVGLNVACYDGWLRRYDTLNMVIIDSIRLNTGLQWLQRDKFGRIWALATDSGRSELFRIQPNDKSIKTYRFGAGKTASRLCVSRSADTLFTLSQGLMAIPAESDQLPSKAIFSMAGANFYGMQCDPHSGLIYFSDVGDFVSKSTVYSTDSRGHLYGNFKSGIITGGFLFYR
jgi:hypothetical protein